MDHFGELNLDDFTDLNRPFVSSTTEEHLHTTMMDPSTMPG